MRGGSQYFNWQMNMEYNDVVKKLNDLIEKIKIAEDRNDEKLVTNLQEEDKDYTEQYLKTEEITKANSNTSEKLQEEFDRIVEDYLKQLEEEKSKLENELEEKLSNTEDYNSVYLVSELQTKITLTEDKIKNIKEISDKEKEREELSSIKKEIINEEIVKLEVRKQELEKEIENKTDENDYMAQYGLGNLQAELHGINRQLEVLKSGNFTKQQIDKAIIEIEKLNKEKTQLKANMPSLNSQDYNELYLLGEQQQIINRMEGRIKKINERLYKLSVFNPDIDKLREEQETKMWEQYKKEKEDEKNRQIDEAFAEKEKMEREEQEAEMWKQYKKEKEDEKNRQIDEAFAEKEKMEKEEERKIAQATRQEIDLDMNTLSYPIVDKNLPGLKIVYDRANNTYVMTDESRAYNATYYFQSTYLKNKSKEMVLEDIGRIRGKEVMPYVLGEIDCNLYYCLSRFDRETGSHKAEEYIESLETGKQINDLDVTYDLRGNRRLSLINDFRQRRIANKSETAIGAKVEKSENKIIKAIKDLFKKVKTTSLPYPDMHLKDGQDINGQEIPSKDIDEKDALSDAIKVHQYSTAEIASYANAYMTRNEQTEERDITASNIKEYLQQLRSEGLSEDMITEISIKIYELENKGINNEEKENESVK